MLFLSTNLVYAQTCNSENAAIAKDALAMVDNAGGHSNGTNSLNTHMITRLSKAGLSTFMRGDDRRLMYGRFTDSAGGEHLTVSTRDDAPGTLFDPKTFPVSLNNVIFNTDGTISVNSLRSSINILNTSMRPESTNRGMPAPLINGDTPSKSQLTDYLQVFFGPDFKPSDVKTGTVSDGALVFYFTKDNQQVKVTLSRGIAQFSGNGTNYGFGFCPPTSFLDSLTAPSQGTAPH